jgi:hypothetical protein
MLGSAIPLLIEMLKHDKTEYGDPSSAVSALRKLAENGRLHPNTITTNLMYTQSRLS